MAENTWAPNGNAGKSSFRWLGCFLRPYCRDGMVNLCQFGIPQSISSWEKWGSFEAEQIRPSIWDSMIWIHQSVLCENPQNDEPPMLELHRAEKRALMNEGQNRREFLMGQSFCGLTGRRAQKSRNHQGRKNFSTYRVNGSSREFAAVLSWIPQISFVDDTIRKNGL